MERLELIESMYATGERNPYQDALEIQDASNMVAVVQTFAAMLRHRIRRGEWAGLSTEPLCLVMIDKLWDMVGRPGLGDERVQKAFAECYAQVAAHRKRAAR